MRAFFLLFGLGLTGISQPSHAATPPTARYWVVLRDKGGVRFNPATYFAPQALARRQRQQLPLADSTDFPVRPDYLQQVQATVDSVVFVSRWFNAVSCLATPAQVAALRHLPGVRSVESRSTATMLPAAQPGAPERGTPEISAADHQLAFSQTASLGAADFRRAKLDGRGLRIAIFDVGFSGADQHTAFQHLRAGKRILATYDFLKKQPYVYAGGSHGTEVLSCIAGKLPDGTALGLAPEAEFLLARTEQLHREQFAEEEAWLAAAEWADRQGVDIINSSLGYTSRRYFPEQMNGRNSLVARAAAMAVRKGILVVNAAGNDGLDPEWRTIGTPADGDSVLAVGGLDPDSFLHIGFSSYGPTADRRLKPNVTAYGTVLAAAPGGYVRTQGTSFASPLLAGFAACAWQQNRNLTAMQLFEKLQASANLYPYFDYAHGYGMPRASWFTADSSKKPPTAATFDFVVQPDSILAVIIRPGVGEVAARALPLYSDSVDVKAPVSSNKPAAVPAVGREELAPPVAESAEKSPPADAIPTLPDPPSYLYWHVADRRGVLRTYEVLDVKQRAVLQISLRNLQAGDIVQVHYRGFTSTYSAQ
ncbi:S8 family serine peptidase [Hymenobacter radiodurans]|uniref:S8 family serine peptidase n=1 Tax=Hymenobacter radiodurans TaxID=2496028 RepID=UPI00105876AD|nr:S8 family serine peptidase [Hymenobacter radiodurans]